MRTIEIDCVVVSDEVYTALEQGVFGTSHTVRQPFHRV